MSTTSQDSATWSIVGPTYGQLRIAVTDEVLKLVQPVKEADHGFILTIKNAELTNIS